MKDTRQSEPPSKSLVGSECESQEAVSIRSFVQVANHPLRAGRWAVTSALGRPIHMGWWPFSSHICCKSGQRFELGGTDDEPMGDKGW